MKYIISVFIFSVILFLAACQNTNSSSSASSEVISKETYLKKGKQIAATTFTVLSANLQKAMKEGGVSNAVKYCNLAALPLVDSLSKAHKAEIRRTSLKIRSPKNKAKAHELAQLQAYEKQLKNGEQLKALVKEIDAQTIAFYAPIHVMSLCEKCHGNLGENLSEENYAQIQKYYPQDKAIGYSSGDWRGMWSILFKK